jgi:Flp pilus assembly protein TadG
MRLRARLLTYFGRQEAGASAVEFALVGPIFMLLLVGIVEFGMAMYNKFALNGAVSAAANYTILNATLVGSTSGATLAQNAALIVANGHAANWANATITINNGPVATLSGGVITTGGIAANANNCYCPTGSGSSLAWGSAMTCGTACAGGGIAGKFVSIVATSQFTSLFAGGPFPNAIPATFTASAVVETN